MSKNIVLAKDCRKVYDKNSSFREYTTSESTMQTVDFTDKSQASACDLLIDKMLLQKVSRLNMLKSLIKFVNENDVIMKNISNDKQKIIARLKRHLTSDTLTRLEKRAISMT